ncbi:MAG: MFS transporter [Dehalococcoidia bacterium]|nr:MFS transporter [Dehalococcoidia bacterium]MDD5495242.1 MFS transporter [Dehalococcoidia bacterium]
MTKPSSALILSDAFLCSFIWSGCGYYAFSLFVNPLQGSFGWERSAVMAALTIASVLSGLLSPLAGTIVHRWGAKNVIVIGALVFGAGMFGLSTINSLVEFYLYSALMGVGMTGIGPIPASTIVTQHFHERRGHAIGIMAAGIGLGGLILSPLIGGLLIPSFGWRASYIILAAFSVLALIPVTLLALRSKETPAVPAGEPELQPHVSLSGFTLRQSLSTPAFWLIMAVVFLLQVSQAGAIQNQVPYMNDLGYPVALASLCLGIIGLMSAVGKYVFGWLCDRIRANHASVVGMALQISGILLLINLTPASPGSMAITYALVLGFGTGSWLPTMSMMVSENFGAREYARIFGAVSLSQALGNGLGPLLTSMVFDFTGDYKIAFFCLLALYVISAPAALSIKKIYAVPDAKTR